MLGLGKRLWQTLTKRQRQRVVLLVGAVVIMALAEVVSVSALAPFLAIAADPAVIGENAILTFLYNFLGFNSINRFLVAIGLGVFALMLFSNAWSALVTWAQLRFVWSLGHQLAVGLLERYLYRPYSYFLSRNTADLSKTILSEVQEVTARMIQPAILALSKVIVALGIVAVLVAVNPMLALLVTVVVGGSYGGIYALTRKRLQAIGHDRLQANRARFTVAGEALGGIKDVKVLNVEDSFLKRFTTPSRRYARNQALHQAMSSLPRYAIETLAFGTVILIIVYLIAAENNFGNIIPMLGVYAFAGFRLMPALQQIFQGVTAVRFYCAAVENVLDDLEGGVKEHWPQRGGVKKLPLERELRLVAVTFTYPTGTRPAINQVSLTIPINSTVGFVGATGSGKTTLADVILGLLRHQRGEILVDGEPITTDNLVAWQGNLGYVPQFIFLADASVAENIAFGVPRDEIDMAAVYKAAGAAQIDRFVRTELPQQYDTVVGERGIRLSGGQRQRIGIARALYRNPSVIVFDEATSALDNTTEDCVMEALKTLHGKKTIIIIAHRVTTLRDCDMLYEVEGGRLVRQGTYGELFGQESFVGESASPFGANKNIG